MYKIDYIKCIYGDKCTQMHTNACINASWMRGGRVFFMQWFCMWKTVILSHVWRQSVHGVRNYGKYSFPFGKQMSHNKTLCLGLGYLEHLAESWWWIWWAEVLSKCYFCTGLWCSNRVDRVRRLLKGTQWGIERLLQGLWTWTVSQSTCLGGGGESV